MFGVHTWSSFSGNKCGFFEIRDDASQPTVAGRNTASRCPWWVDHNSSHRFLPCYLHHIHRELPQSLPFEYSTQDKCYPHPCPLLAFTFSDRHQVFPSEPSACREYIPQSKSDSVGFSSPLTPPQHTTTTPEGMRGGGVATLLPKKLLHKSLPTFSFRGNHLTS